MAKEIHAVLLCTSPLQVINAKAAVDKNQKSDGIERKLTVVMIHPLLSITSKRCVKRISSQLKCEVIDLSLAHEKMLREGRSSEEYGDAKSSALTHRAKRLLDRYTDWQQKIGGEIESHVGDIQEAYCRSRVSALETFFLGALEPEVKKFGIEDGLGDYVPSSWPISHLNFYEIRHKVRRLVTTSGVFFAGGVLTHNWSKWKEISSLSTPKWSDEFSVLERSGYRSTSKEFLRNLRRLENHDVEVPRIGVLILGTLFSPRFKFNITEEVQFYNQRIQAITREHNVGREEIYYKHHPRLSREQWQYKNEQLDCNVVPFESETIAEEELLRPGVSAAYSVGSTSLLYARPLFGVPSFCWDLSMCRDVHPSHFKKYRYLALRHQIPLR